MEVMEYICIDSKIRGLEPWYLNGTLSNDEKRAFEDHLRYRPKCADDLPLDKVIFSILKEGLAPVE